MSNAIQPSTALPPGPIGTSSSFDQLAGDETAVVQRGLSALTQHPAAARLADYLARHGVQIDTADAPGEVAGWWKDGEHTLHVDSGMAAAGAASVSRVLAHEMGHAYLDKAGYVPQLAAALGEAEGRIVAEAIVETVGRNLFPGVGPRTPGFDAAGQPRTLQETLLAFASTDAYRAYGFDPNTYHDNPAAFDHAVQVAMQFMNRYAADIGLEMAVEPTLDLDARLGRLLHDMAPADAAYLRAFIPTASSTQRAALALDLGDRLTAQERSEYVGHVRSVFGDLTTRATSSGGGPDVVTASPDPSRDPTQAPCAAT